MQLTRNLALASLLAMSLAWPVAAADLTIGRATEPSSIDPQFSRTGNNQSTARLMFNRLISTDPNLRVGPELATSWKNIDPLTWEVSLRANVTFHDGSPFTADDVIFSLDRVSNIPNSPAPFTGMVAGVASVEKIDDLTIRVTTDNPLPGLMENIGRVFIVSKAAAENASSDDFNSGQAAIGTGPYKFVSWDPGSNLEIEAYDGYWGDQPEFKEVDIRFISNAAARVAALLSGSVDIVDAVPPSDVELLNAEENIKVESAASGRVIYLGLSMRFDQAPTVTDLDGNPLEENPFRDLRVRKAVSLMIDRQLMIDRILGGSGVPAGQIAPAALGGHAVGLMADAADPARAKELLAEAGYPEGFGLTIYSSNNRFPGDADVGQALGQMLTRGGLKVNAVETLPYNVYSKAATKGDFGAFVFSLGSSTPSSAPGLSGLIKSYDKEAGTGRFNRVRFSSAEFDAALNIALQEFDAEKRYDALAAATVMAFEQMPVVPLYWQKVHWGMRSDLTMPIGLVDETLAQNISTSK